MTAKLVVDDGVDNPTEGEIFRAQISWDSPMFGQKNQLKIELAEGNNKQIIFTCRDDYNKRGGALGNVECKIDGVVVEKKAPLTIIESPKI